MLKLIPWEKISTDGDVAVLYKFKNIKHSASPLKDTAIQKLIDVAAISAEFKNESMLYLPAFWILFDYDDSNIEFYGAYLSDDLRDDPDSIIPDLCLRKGIWKRSHDKEQVEYNQDYDKYVWSSKHTSVSIFFVHTNKFPKIKRLIYEFRDYLTTRLHFRQSQNLELQVSYAYLKIGLYNEDLKINIEYCPLFQRDVLLEEQVELWKECFLDITFESSFIPDKNSCKLSYFWSVMERLAVYSERRVHKR